MAWVATRSSATWGEAIPFTLDRIEETTPAMAKTMLKRSVRQAILEQAWITTGGFFTTVPLMAFGGGPDHVLGRLPVCFEWAGAGVPGRAAGVADG